MSIDNLSISYPDFVLNTTIDPEQFDTNNLEIVTKINQIIDNYNAITASKIPLVAIGGIVGNDVQAVLESLKTYVELLNATVSNSIETHKSNTNNPHNITPAQLGVYTKAELQPYLTGGDTIIKYDVFTIINSNVGDGTFTYSDKNNVTYTGVITSDGYQKFTLLNGTYTLGENRIEAFINDTAIRSVASGGLIEDTNNTIILNPPVSNGIEVTFKYFEKIGVINSGIAYASNQPPSGFIWLKDLS